MAEWTPFLTHYISGDLVVPGIETETSRSVARNPYHQTTEAVYIFFIYIHTYKNPIN
jgi:hypothetical protein